MLLGLLVLVAAAPYVVAPLWGPAILSSVANARIQGAVSVDAISLPWIGAVELRGLTLRDPAGRKVLEVASVRLDRGLLKAALSGAAFGQVDILRPRTTLYPTAGGRYSIQDALESRLPETPSGEKKPSQPRGRLVLTGGGVEVVRPDGTRFAATDLAFDCRIAAMDDIRLTFSTRAGASGALRGEAAFRDARPDGQFDPATASGSLSLETDKPLDLAEMAPLTGRKSVYGRVSVDLKATIDNGRFDSTLALGLADASTIGVSQVPPQPINVTVKAAASGTRDAFQGWASLAGDLRDAKLTFKAAAPGAGHKVTADEVVQALLHGRAVALPEFLVTLAGDLDVARLARAAPALVNVRHDAILRTCSLEFQDVRIAGGAKPSLRGRVQLAGVEALVAGKGVQWDAMSLDLAVWTDDRDRLHVDRADVDLGKGILQAQAKGAADNFTVRTWGDLGLLHEKLGRVFDLSAFRMAGRFDVKTAVRRSEPDPRTGLDASTLHLFVDVDGRADAVTFRRADRPVTDFALSSALQWKLELLKTADVFAARGAGTLSGTDVTIRGDQARLERVVLEHNVGYEPGLRRLTIRKAKLTSDAVDVALDVETPAVIVGFDLDSSLALSGTYALRWDKLTPLLRQLDGRTPENLAALKAMGGRFRLARKAGGIDAAFDFAGTLGRLALQAKAPDIEALRAVDVPGLLQAAWRGEPLPPLPEAQLAVDALLHMEVLAAATPEAARRVDVPRPVEGELEFRQFHLSGGPRPAASGKVSLTKAAVAFEGQTEPFGDVLLQGDVSVDSSRRLQIGALAITAPGVSVTASGTAMAVALDARADLTSVGALYGRWFDLGATLGGAGRIKGRVYRAAATDKYFQAELEGQLDRASFRRVVLPGVPAAAPTALPAVPAAAKAPAAKAPGTTEISAALSYAGRLDWSDGHRAAGMLTVKDLLIRSGDFRHEQPALTLAHDVHADTAGDLLKIAKLQVASQPDWISLEAAGTVRQWRTARLLHVEGKYGGNWDKVFAVIKSMDPSLPVPEDYILHGPTSEPFAWDGSLTDPKLMNGNTGVSWVTGQTLGLDLGAAAIKPTMKAGVLTIPLSEMPASGGVARLGGTVDMRGRAPVLQLPGNLQVLDRVHLSKDFTNKVLSRANPIFAGLGRIEGNVSLRINDLRTTLGAAGKADAVGSGRLELTEVKFQPAGLLGQLLPLLGAPGGRDYTLQVSPLDFRIRNGAIEYENFRIVIDKSFDLIFSGRIGFDDKVQMTVSVPVHEALLRKLGAVGPLGDYARLLKSARISIPIVGGRNAPGLDLGRVKIDTLVRQASEALLKEQAGQFLRK